MGRGDPLIEDYERDIRDYKHHIIDCMIFR
jgi:hypothetical protein